MSMSTTSKVRSHEDRSTSYTHTKGKLGISDHCIDHVSVIAMLSTLPARACINMIV